MTLGIDIGGTNLSFGLVENSKVTESFSVPSFAPDATLEETLEYLASKIRIIITPSVKKIGIGVPSVVDVNRGIVYDTQNIPSWTVVPLKEYLESRFHIPVSVNNDANCYALGVYGSYPAGERPETLVAMTLGTGLGIGIVDRGVLFCGANCCAGELGCLPYAVSIIEDYCSKKFFTTAGWSSLDANMAAKAGDPAALALFEEFGRHMGAALCAVMYAYDPDRVALAGGVANNYPFFRQAMETYVRENFPYRKAVERLKIDICTDSNLPVIGAALL
jgi:glucokinase